MVRGKTGFTLSELLVVISIIAIVALITFPVMRGAMDSAKKASCASNFHQAQLASTLYLTDYDDHFMLVNYKVEPQPGDVDRTWVQLVLPYLAEFDVFRCPADSRHWNRADALFDIDLMPDNTYDRYYRASKLSNIGYNYLYLSPVVKSGETWSIQSRTVSQVSDPSTMLLFVDTIAPREHETDAPGGGSYIVIPPCRISLLGEDTFRVNTQRVFSPTPGWISDDSSTEKFGRAWPWHTGRANVSRVSGGTRSLTMAQLASGCDVKDDWSESRVNDLANYPWDMN